MRRQPASPPRPTAYPQPVSVPRQLGAAADGGGAAAGAGCRRGMPAAPYSAPRRPAPSRPPARPPRPGVDQGLARPRPAADEAGADACEGGRAIGRRRAAGSARNRAAAGPRRARSPRPQLHRFRLPARTRPRAPAAADGAGGDAGAALCPRQPRRSPRLARPQGSAALRRRLRPTCFRRLRPTCFRRLRPTCFPAAFGRPGGGRGIQAGPLARRIVGRGRHRGRFLGRHHQARDRGIGRHSIGR